MTHRLLERQLRKLELDRKASPSLELWRRFIEHVERSYLEADQDRYLLERSLAISSREMQDLYDGLKQASETQIAAERDRLKAVMENVADGIITFDEETCVLSANSAAERMFGYSRKRMQGFQIAELFTHLETFIGSNGDSGMPGAVTTTALTNHGESFPVELSIGEMVQGTDRQFIAIVRDITERVRSEQAVRASESRIRAFTRALPDLAFIMDEDGRYIEILTPESDLLAFPVDQLLGNTYHEIFEAETADLFLGAVKRTIDSGDIETLEYDLDVSDARRSFEARFSPMPPQPGQKRLVVKMARDITERKRAEAGVRASELRIRKHAEDLALLNALNNAVNEGASLANIYDLMIQGTKQIFSGQGAVVFLLDETGAFLRLENISLPLNIFQRLQSVTGDALKSLKIPIEQVSWFHRVIRQGESLLIDRAADAENLVEEIAMALVLPAGVPRAASLKIFSQIFKSLEIGSMMLVPLASGSEIIGLLEISRSQTFEPDDLQRFEAFAGQLTVILKRKQAEGQLGIQAAALANAANAIMITDLDGVITWVNPAFAKLTGYESEEVVGQHTRLLKSDRQSTDVYRRLWETIKSGRVWQGELINRRKDGSIYTEEQTITPVFDEQENITHFVAVKQDITAQVEHEYALQKKADQQEQILETARHLTASLEFRDVLTQIGQRARAIVQAEGCRIYLLEADGATLSPMVSLNPTHHQEISSEPVAVTGSFPGKAILERKTVVANRPEVGESAALETPALSPAEAICSIVSPFVVEDEVLGAMELTRPGLSFTEEDRTLVEMFATYASTALRNARTYQDLHREVDERIRAQAEIYRRNEELALLNRVTAAASQTLEPNAILETVCRELSEAFGVPQAAAALLTPDGRTLEVVAEYLAPGQPSAMGVLIEIDGNPATEFVVRNQVPLAIPDAQNDPQMAPVHSLMRERGTVSLLIIPLLVRGKLLGTIGLDSVEERSFSEQEINLALTAATTAIQAIDTARLFDETRRRAEELEALAEVSSAMRSAASRDEIFPIILNQMLFLLEADGAALILTDAVSDENVIELARGAWASMTGQKHPPGEGLIGQVIATLQPHCQNEPDPEDTFTNNPGPGGTLPALVCIPLIAQEKAIGALCVGRQQPFKESEIQLINAIADMSANAIHRESLRLQTERRVQRLGALRMIDEAITASVDLRLTLNILIEQVAVQLNVDAVSVLLLAAHTQVLEHVAQRGFRGNALNQEPVRMGEGLAGRAALERRILHVPDLASAADDPRAPLLSREGFSAYYAVPLIAKGQVKGLLEILNREPLKPDPEWMDFLETLARQAAIAVDNVGLFDSLQRSNIELTLAYDATIEGWAHALELRDQETKGHSQRVTEMTIAIGRELGMSEEELEQVRRGALLHDIGKMGVPDSILNKPGPLTEEEWEVMRQHPVWAHEMLSPIAYLRPALEIPYSHHEKWDGSGYPHGLAGEQIPLAARIFSVVDVWDALRSDRPYRSAWTEERALDYIREQAGKHFDPEVVAVFLRVLAESGMEVAFHPQVS